MEFHPDKNPGDHTAEVKFKEINEAYDVLKDDQKRAAYDRFGHAAFENGMGARGARAVRFDFASSFTDVFEDLFGELMGGRRGQARQSRPGSALQSRDHAWKKPSRGRSAEIKVPTAVACETCSGSRRRSRATAPRPAPPAPVTARCAPPRASSPSSAPARLPRHRQDHPPSLQDLPRRGPGAEGTHAAVSMCRPASRKARASACPAKARRA